MPPINYRANKGKTKMIGCSSGIYASAGIKKASPLDIPGCILWLDATDATTLRSYRTLAPRAVTDGTA